MRPPTDRKVRWGNQHYWDVIRAFPGTFTVRDLYGQSSGPTLESVRVAVHRLARMGYLALVGEVAIPRTAFRAKLYRCARPDAKAPVQRDPGQTGIHGRRQRHLWTAMRTLPQWTAAELALAASTDDVEVTATCAAGYVWRLAKAGIVQVLRPRRSGRGGGGTNPALYRLRPARNTGPRPPEVHRGRGVFDPNTKAWVQIYEPRNGWAGQAPAERIAP